MASRALVYTGQALAEVAIGCGFSDQSHFTREFRRHFGRTPREYREHYARDGGDAAPVPNPAADEQESDRPRAAIVQPVRRSDRVRPRPFDDQRTSPMIEASSP